MDRGMDALRRRQTGRHRWIDTDRQKDGHTDRHTQRQKDRQMQGREVWKSIIWTLPGGAALPAAVHHTALSEQ
jgi:hypothetical protein